MAALIPLSRRKPQQPARQQGYVLLLTLITLLVLLFGVLFTMRGTVLQTAMVGNTVQRQKDVQTSDIALRVIQQTLINASNNAGGAPLETISPQPAWFSWPSSSAAAWWPAPNAAYWTQAIQAGNAYSVPLPAGTPARAWALVVSANLASDRHANGCPSGTRGTYYDIFIHTAEANNVTAANTETLFKLCTVSSS